MSTGLPSETTPLPAPHTRGHPAVPGWEQEGVTGAVEADADVPADRRRRWRRRTAASDIFEDISEGRP